MSKQKIREWLENNCNTENIVDIIDQYTKDQSARVRIETLKEMKSRMVVGLLGESKDYEKGFDDCFDQLTKNIDGYISELEAPTQEG